MTTLVHIMDGRRVLCVTITDAPEGWWARPVECVVRFFFPRNEWRYGCWTHHHEAADGWVIRVAVDSTIGRCATSAAAIELQKALARPEAYLDNTDDNIDLTEGDKMRPNVDRAFGDWLARLSVEWHRAEKNASKN